MRLAFQNHIIVALSHSDFQMAHKGVDKLIK